MAIEEPASTAMQAVPLTAVGYSAAPSYAAGAVTQRNAGPPFATSQYTTLGDLGRLNPPEPRHSAAAVTLTPGEYGAGPSYAAGKLMQKSTGTPFATTLGGMLVGLESLGSPDQRYSTAAVSGTPAHAAGRQNRKSVSPPFATAEDAAQAVRLTEPVSKESSPPYATHESQSADSLGKRAQARLLLHGGQAQTNARHEAPSLPERYMAAGAEIGAVRGDHESTALSVDNAIAESADASSPRHSVSSLRPYANEASLQVLPSAISNTSLVLYEKCM